MMGTVLVVISTVMYGQYAKQGGSPITAHINQPNQTKKRKSSPVANY